MVCTIAHVIAHSGSDLSMYDNVFTLNGKCEFVNN